MVVKTIAEIKFDRVVREGFHEVLRPLGFKKKANNFYLFQNGIGHIINIQRSKISTKDHIQFTINTGVFLPEFWDVFYNYFNKSVPEYPTEPECILRARISQLRNEPEQWYDVTANINAKQFVEEMKKNLHEYVLPHFNQILSKDMLVRFMDQRSTGIEPIEKLIVFGELGELEKAKKEADKLLAGAERNPGFVETVNTYRKKYGLF